MKLRDLIEKLCHYNQEADVVVICHGREEQFSLSYGGDENCTKETCDSVGFYVDKLNNCETTPT